MRALLAAIRCPKGDVEQNLAAHLGLLAEARAAGCALVLFPEMSLTGSADPAAHPERLIGVLTGGRARPWTTRAATRAAGACGSPWRVRPAPRSMRTSPAWRRWSGRTAA